MIKSYFFGAKIVAVKQLNSTMKNKKWCVAISKACILLWCLSSCISLIKLQCFKPQHMSNQVIIKFHLSPGSRFVPVFLKTGCAIRHHAGSTIACHLPPHRPALCQPAAARPWHRHLRCDSYSFLIVCRSCLNQTLYSHLREAFSLQYQTTETVP